MIRLLPIASSLCGAREILYEGNACNEHISKSVKRWSLYPNIYFTGTLEDRMRNLNAIKAEHWFDFSELPEPSYVVEPQVQPDTWLEMAGKYGYVLDPRNNIDKESISYLFDKLIFGEHTKKIYY